jgi:putative aldouronate transport system permease protein
MYGIIIAFKDFKFNLGILRSEWVGLKYFRTLFVFSGLWKEAGWGTIIYLSAITSIDKSLYEAAIVDGANRLSVLY